MLSELKPALFTEIHISAMSYSFRQRHEADKSYRFYWPCSWSAGSMLWSGRGWFSSLRKLLHRWLSRRQTVCHRGINSPRFFSQGGGFWADSDRRPLLQATDSADGHEEQSANGRGGVARGEIKAVNVFGGTLRLHITAFCSTLSPSSISYMKSRLRRELAFYQSIC